jgi:hypothetical protein
MQLPRFIARFSRPLFIKRHSPGRAVLSLGVAAWAVLSLCGRAPGSPGDVYVALANGTISKVAPGGTVTTFATQPPPDFFGTNSLTVDGGGNVYASNWEEPTGTWAGIEKFAPDGSGSTFVWGGVEMGGGLACDKAGNVYNADRGPDPGTDWIAEFAPDGTGSMIATSSGQGLSEPKSLAFDPAGNMWVTNSETVYQNGQFVKVGELLKLSLYGGTWHTVASLSAPDDVYGLACDKAGNVYVADQFGGRILKYDARYYNETVFATGLSYPAGLAFDRDGNLFVANGMGGDIDEFAPNGDEALFATVQGPTWLAIDTSPEPGTLLLLALGATGLLRRKR